MNGDGPPSIPPHRPYGRQRFQPRPSGAPQASAVGGGKSPYRLGRDFERATRGRLERRGYFVMRATLSKGKVDLLAVKVIPVEDPHPLGPRALDMRELRHVVLGVQCKRRGDIGSAEWNELMDVCEPFGITPVVACKSGERTTAFYRLDEKRVPRAQGRPWTAIDVATGEALPEQMALSRA